jgi:hypothetical protein
MECRIIKVLDACVAAMKYSDTPPVASFGVRIWTELLVFFKGN